VQLDLLRPQKQAELWSAGGWACDRKVDRSYVQEAASQIRFRAGSRSAHPSCWRRFLFPARPAAQSISKLWGREPTGDGSISAGCCESRPPTPMAAGSHEPTNDLMCRRLTVLEIFLEDFQWACRGGGLPTTVTSSIAHDRLSGSRRPASSAFEGNYSAVISPGRPGHSAERPPNRRAASPRQAGRRPSKPPGKGTGNSSAGGGGGGGGGGAAMETKAAGAEKRRAGGGQFQRKPRTQRAWRGQLCPGSSAAAKARLDNSLLAGR